MTLWYLKKEERAGRCDDIYYTLLNISTQNCPRAPAYYTDNEDVMMELEDIDLIFSDQEAMPMPGKEYREYMKERKKEAKDKAKADKRK